MTSNDTRLAAFDAVMIGVEQDPVLRSTIVAMILLDSEPDIDVGIARVDRMTRAVPKLRQLVSQTTGSLLPPRWDTDPNFDLSYHLRQYRVPDEDGTLRPVLRIAEQMAEQDFDRSRPLWELALVTGLPDGGAALIFKIHHSITDGVGGMLMAASLFDLTAEPSLPEGPDPEVPEPRSTRVDARVLQGAMEGARQSADSARRYANGALDLVTRALRDPAGTVAEGAIFATSAARVLAPASEALSPVMQGRTLSMRMDLIEGSLAELKLAGKSSGGTLNDAFMAVVCGGLQRYHEAHGQPVSDVRVNMPVNMRSDGEVTPGNHWVPARFLIPIDITDPRERIKALSPILRAARTEPALPISDFVMRRLQQLPQSLMTTVAGGLMKGTDVAATNVPGPPFPVYVAGSRVRAIVPFAPKGGAALNVGLMSYDGRVFLGLNIDTGAVHDPEVLVECMAEALQEVLALGREPAPATEPKPAAKRKPTPRKRPVARPKATT